MRLLSKSDYIKVEKLLRNYMKPEFENPINYGIAIDELKEFFSESEVHTVFLENFYLNRALFKNRFPANGMGNMGMNAYISSKVYTSPYNLYFIRKEIIYKAAMIFYKYKILY